MERITKDCFGTGNNQGEGSTRWSLPKRWCPTTDQIRILQTFYQDNGGVIPSPRQIHGLCDELRQYGDVQPKSIYFWFQNRRAREKQKKKPLMATGDAPTPGPFKRRNSEYPPTSPSEGVSSFEGFVVPSSPFSVQGDALSGFIRGVSDSDSSMDFLPPLSQQDPSLEHYLTESDETSAQSGPSSLSPMRNDDDASQDLLQLSLKPYAPSEQI